MATSPTRTGTQRGSEPARPPSSKGSAFTISANAMQGAVAVQLLRAIACEEYEA